jgi:hypothetical protein
VRFLPFFHSRQWLQLVHFHGFVSGDYILDPEGVFEKAVLFVILIIVVVGIFACIHRDLCTTWQGNIFA